MREVTQLGTGALADYLAKLSLPSGETDISATEWDSATYRPVPGVIEAATSIFAGHDVRDIAKADADNLRSAAQRLLTLIEQARIERKRYLLLLTGVPGSGKTLAGLQVVHGAIATGVEREGDIVYLSGNTPLVLVLREALARDEYARRKRQSQPAGLASIRLSVRARIQHINDFLQESLRGSPDLPPHEHVIVFDEAQRAWDKKRGIEKFDRTASEPSLILELMSRHSEWCACVCLIGTGQEINSGEEGISGWGEALRDMPPNVRREWTVFAPLDVLHNDASANFFTLGELPSEIDVREEHDLHLTVPQRTYRSPNVSRWVDAVLAGDASSAREAASGLNEYPILLTRSLTQAKSWLRSSGRGERRYGLLASSGARRLRADGLGVTLHANAGVEIAHWYLNAPGDIRSSYALEVPANEYTCQGLEIDFACLCWGGDLLWNQHTRSWNFCRLSGPDWRRIQQPDTRRYVTNSYRVLLTRAREGLIIWIPTGDQNDSTHRPLPFDLTAMFLSDCGATQIDPRQELPLPGR